MVRERDIITARSPASTYVHDLLVVDQGEDDLFFVLELESQVAQMFCRTGAVVHMHDRIPALVAVLAIPHRDISPPKWDQLAPFCLDNIDCYSLSELSQIPAVNTFEKVRANELQYR